MLHGALPITGSGGNARTGFARRLLKTCNLVMDAMRTIILLTVVAASGCHLWGETSRCQKEVCQTAPCGRSDCESVNGESVNGESVNGCGSEPGCEPCGDCHACLGGHIPALWGRHPKFVRFEDNLHTSKQARFRAALSLHAVDDKSCLTCDYRLGYEQAFVDVAHGADGETPALPPANYWKNCMRTPRGHQKAQQWFSGYAAGSVAARSIYEPYNKVAASQLVGDEWGRVNRAGTVVPGEGSAFSSEMYYGQ